MSPTSNASQVTIYHDNSQDTCSIACVMLPLRDLVYHSNSTRVCCWLMSADNSHKIYIDVNLTKLLGEGSWAMVYDTQLHDDVKYIY